MRQQKVTLTDVAAEAGVSVATASKAVRGRDVADQTRARVHDAVRRLGYRSPGAPSSWPDAPPVVDLVIGRLASAYSIEVLRGVVDLAAESGVEVVVGTGPGTEVPDRGDAWARRLAESGRRGVILVTNDEPGPAIDVLQAYGVPVILIDSLAAPRDDVPTVGATNWAGGRAAVDHLLGLGHRRIGFIGGPREAECVQARMHGYLASLVAAGVEADPTLRCFGRFDRETGVEGARRLVGLGEPPTAIFAASDGIAVGVLAELHRRGLNVPRDVSLVGFDGLPVGADAQPSLTSVEQPLREIGRTALRTVLRLKQEAPAEGTPHLELATRLVVRDSTAGAGGQLISGQTG